MLIICEMEVFRMQFKKCKGFAIMHFDPSSVSQSKVIECATSVAELETKLAAIALGNQLLLATYGTEVSCGNLDSCQTFSQAVSKFGEISFHWMQDGTSLCF